MPQWQWSTSFPGKLRTGSVTDLAGNTFITGTFSGNLSIGDSSFTSSGGRDIFIAKFNSVGQFIWANHAGGATDDNSRGITVDNAGNAYIIGKYTDTAYFDAQKLVSIDSVINQNRIYAGDLFIAKYNKTGQLVWAKSAGSKYDDHGYGITVDNKGGLYVCGDFASYGSPNPAFGVGYFDSVSVVSIGFQSMFLAKYDTAGKALWAKTAGGIRDYNSAYNVLIDRNGQVVVSGLFNGTYMNFDAIRVNSTYHDGSSIFITRYDTVGNVIWAKAAGGSYPGDIAVYGMTVDSSNNVFVTGTAGSVSSRFDNYVLRNDITDPTSGRILAFLAKYNSSGAVQWAKNICSNTVDYTNGFSVTADKTGNAYVSGDYGGYCSVKAGDTLRSYGNYDAYVAKFDAAGNGVWATHAGGTGGESPYSIAMDGQGGLYVSGITSSTTATFGNSTLSGTGQDIFIAKLASATGIRVLPSEDDGVAVFPNPNAGEFSVKYPVGDFDQLQLADVQGKIIYQQTLQPTTQGSFIHLPSIAPGFYLLRLNGASRQASRKLFIQR